MDLLTLILNKESLMSEPSAQKSGCFGCLGTLLFLIFVVPSLISGLIQVFQGDAKVSLKSCSLQISNGVGVKCQPQITSKYQFFDITNLESKKTAITTSVQDFHTRIGQAQCQTIYQQASDVLKQNNKQADFLKYCSDSYQALGTLKSFEIVGWEWLPLDEDSNEYIRVYSKASFSKLTISETLIWQIKDKQPSLAGYAWKSTTGSQ
ncbi:hypothetical protein [Nostoc sp.]